MGKYTREKATIQFTSEAKDKALYNVLQNRLNALNETAKTVSKDYEMLGKNWMDTNTSNAYAKRSNEYYLEVDSTRKYLQDNANDFKKILGQENYDKVYGDLDNVLKGKAKADNYISNVVNIYSQYETAEDYNKAKREYGYSVKYQGKTYDDISKYLSSDDYKTMRRRGLVSDEENTWLKNYKINAATSDQIQAQIDDLGGSAEQIKNKVHNLNLDLDDLQAKYREGKISEQDYKARSLSIQNEIDRQTKNIDEISILATIKEKKKQLEEFNKKWDAEIKGLNNTIPVPTNEQLKSVLVTDDEVGLSSEAASNASDGTPAGQAGAVIGKFISDLIKDSKDEIDFDDYAEYLTDVEKKNIINIAKTNPVKATQYFKDLIALRLDDEYNQTLEAEASGFTSQNRLFAKLGSVGSIVTSLGSGIETVGNWLTGNTDRRSRLASTTTGLREGTKTHWDGTEGEKVWDFLYDTGMSAADSVAAAGLSAVVPFSGEFLLGASAAANTYNDMLDRGVTGGDAILGSVAAGVAESLFEHVSIGKILDVGDITKGWTKAGIKQAVKKVGTDMLVNLSEESATEIANIITDNLISGDLSSYAIAAEQYYMQGYSAEEAKKKAAQDLGEQVAMAGLSGALMGFGFGAGGSVVGLSNSNIKNSKAGNAVLNAENGLATLKTIASQKGDAEVKSAAEKLTENSKPSQVGYVFNRLYEQSVEKSIDAMLPELTENGATKGGSNSAKGWASQIIKTAIAPESDDKRSKANTLRANKVTSNVYAAFADEGKYGAATLFELNDLVAFKPATKEQIAENINQDIADSNELRESHRPTFGTNELPAEVRANLDKISANKIGGPVSQIFGKNVTANLEKQRPAPKKSDKIKITPKGENFVKQLGKAMGVKVVFTDDLVDGKGDGKTVDHKTVYISRYSVNPMKELIKHEFTHTTEISKLYSKFSKHIFNDSKAFNSWIKQKGYTSWSELADEIIETFHENDVSYEDEYDAAKREIVAMFVSENLFNEKTANEEITSDFLSELRRIDRAWYERFIDWVKSIFARLKTVDGIQRDIIKLEQQFLRLVETASEQRTEGIGNQEKPQYLIDKYWYPNMTKSEITLVRRIAKREVNTTEKYIDNKTKWLYNNVGGKSFFALYSTEDLNEPTILYACKGNRADFENQLLVEQSEKEYDNESDDSQSGIIDGILSRIKNSVSGKDIHSINTMGRSGNNGNASVYSQNTRNRPSEAFINCLRNIAKAQEQRRTDDRKISNSSKKVNSQYLFVGENSKLANKLTLTKAKQMLKDGEDSETIRKATGWFKGYDGKWRFEISDKELQFKAKHNVFLTKLLAHGMAAQAMFKNSRSDIEVLRPFVNAHSKAAKEYEKVKIESIKLGDLISHSALFKAYPHLKNTKVNFKGLEGAKGEYDPRTGEININKYHDFKTVKQLKKTLIHEIQHAVQRYEGFALGASNVLWERTAVPKYSNGRTMTANRAYHYTAGEIEARDVAKRLDLDDAKRREKRPNIDEKNVVFVEKSYAETARDVQYSIPSDHVYSYNNGKASFTEDRLTALLDEHSLGDGKRADYSNAFVAYISPSDFVNLTTNNTIRGRVEDEAYILDEDELRNETETPFIEYNPETGEVVNHEGRHRMVALQAEGISNVAVVLKPSTDSFARLQPQDINLIGQDFAGGKAQGNVTIKNAIPLSEKYRDETTAQFAQNPDADVRYSLPSVDILTEEQYNNFGWVRANNILTAAEYSDLLSNYTGHKHIKDKYPITRFGETVIHSAQYTDVLMYVKGPIRNPQITKVVRIVHPESWAIPYIKEEILSNEYKQDYQPFKTVESYFGYGVLDISKARDYDSYREYRAKLERNDSPESDTTGGTERDGAGSTEQNKTTDRADPIDGPAYSLPETQYAIPDIAKGKTNTELEALVKDGTITLDEAFEELVAQHGAIKPGERPKVDVTLPNKISKTKHVMRWVRTAAESGHLDDGMRNDQRKEILNGAMTYQVISDKAALRKADDALRDDFAGAVQKWEDIINSGKQMTKFDIALGERLLQQAAENGHASDVMKYTAELAELGTRMGQNIQALRLLKKMTGIGKLYYIQRTVNSLNRDIEQKYGGKKPPVKIDPSFAKILANSKNSAEAETVEADMIKDIANQMPSTFLDKWNAWRYLSMLGNPRTHIRNIMGNAVFVPAIRIRHGLSYAGERFIAKDKRTKILGLLKPEYRDFARSDFEAMKDILTGGGKMNPSDKIRDQQKIFKTKALEIIRNKNFAFMEAEDMLFLKMHYVRALGSALQARGIDIANISDEQLNVARLYAIKEAQKATYRDASAVAEALNRFQYSKSKSVRAFGMLVEGILPFKKTPINILKRGVEYSPVGLVTSLTKGIADLKKGKMTADEFIDGISAGLTGTGIMALGMLLQSLGIIVGGLDYDDEDALERMSGAQPYSIQVGDISYTIDWMAPAVLPFLVGAEVEKFLESDNERDPIGFAVDALAAIGEPLTELSMLSGLNDAIEAVAYSDNKLTDMAISAGTSYLSQAVPTIGGQIARTFDDTRRSNFVDKNSAVPKGIQTAYQKALGKIPFAENTKVPYIDAWGRTEVNDNVLLRAFENFVSPGYVSTIEDDKVNKQIAEIYVDTGASGVLPKRAGTSIQVDGVTKNLTADEYVQYATDKGQYSRKYLEDFINHPMYSGLDNQSKADIISDLYSYANAKAKSNVSDYDYTTVSTYKTAAKLETAGIDPVSYYIARVATSKENADTDGSGTVSKKEKQKALKNAGFSNSEVNTIINVNKK